MRLLVLLLCLPLFANAAGESPFELQLAKAEQAALESSNLIQATGFELQADEAERDAGFTLLFPRIALDGNDRYVTDVPDIKLGAGPAVPFGSANNYSAGIGASWTFLDWGNALNLYRSLGSLRDSKASDLEAKRREVKLQARLSYFQTQLMAERAKLMADSLKLAQSQAKDIELRLKAGASSRIDALASQNDVLVARGEYRSARADLAAALRDLFALTGLGSDLDPSVPQEASSAEAAPEDTEPATLTLRTQSLESSLEDLAKSEDLPFNTNLPQLQMLRATALAARQQADAYRSEYWPTFKASARASVEYPEVPFGDFRAAEQNTFIVSGSWPIFPFGNISGQIKQQDALAQSQDKKAAAQSSDLHRDWLKSHDRLKALRDEKALDEQSVAATDSYYKLVYGSYHNGSSSYLEVQQAELGALQSKVRLASTETQMLIELAMLSSLSE